MFLSPHQLQEAYQRKRKVFISTHHVNPPTPCQQLLTFGWVTTYDLVSQLGVSTSAKMQIVQEVLVHARWRAQGRKRRRIIFSRGAMTLVGCRREEENPTRVRSWVENCGIVKFIEFRCKMCFFLAARASCLKDCEWRQRQEGRQVSLIDEQSSRNASDYHVGR